MRNSTSVSALKMRWEKKADGHLENSLKYYYTYALFVFFIEYN